MDKFYFPMETMRITQNPYGDTSHHNHNLGDPKDYPIDCAGCDGGRSAAFAPVDMKITAIRKGKKISNTIWLVSENEVNTPTFNDKVFMTLTHWNDNDEAMRNHKTGDIVRKGEIICFEGTDEATGNHLHICCGRGYSDNWDDNSLGSTVMIGDNKPPEEVMYIYTKFTESVMDEGGLNWTRTDTDYEPDIKYVGQPVERNTKVDQLSVKVENLRARKEPTLNGEILGYINMGFYDIQDKAEADGYTWYRVQDMWIAYNEDWLDILPKEEKTPEEIQEEYKIRILTSIDEFLDSLIER